MYNYKNRARALFAFWALLALLLVSFNADAAAPVVRRDAFLGALVDARGFAPAPVKGKTPAKGKAPAKYELALKYGFVGASHQGLRLGEGVKTGKMSAPISRREAVCAAVQSLGLSFEAQALSGLNATVTDGKKLSAFERGCLTVAQRMFPPLWNGSGKAFQPEKNITPQEMNMIISAVRDATKGLLLDVNITAARGAEICLHREGAHTNAPRWRVNVYEFADRNEAEALCARLAEKGYKFEPSYLNYVWQLRGAELLDDWRRVEAAAALIRKAGKYPAVVPNVVNKADDNLPFYWTLLKVDPKRFDMRVMLAPDGMSSLAPLSVMRSNGDEPLIAVNAGFFLWSGYNAGSPIGTVMLEGALAASPSASRTTMAWTNSGASGVRVTFGVPLWKPDIMTAEGTMRLSHLNQYSPKYSRLVLYTPQYGVTPTPERNMCELHVKGGRCVGKSYGGSAVPDGEVILAGYDDDAAMLEKTMPGDPVLVNMRLSAPDDMPEVDEVWKSMKNAMQAGPMLLRGGEPVYEREGFEMALVNMRHPRTAVGITRAGEWALFVGDGRNGMHSGGYSLPELTALLQSLDVTYAMNLDGGASTELLIKNKPFNWPSNGRERPISTALGIFPRK